VSPLLDSAKNEQYSWNWIGRQLQSTITSIFLKYHYFQFQKRTKFHKYSVSSAIQWLVKNEIVLHEPNSRHLKKTRYCCTVHKHNKILSARKLKCLLKIYIKKHDNEQLVFGNIINLFNRMY